jgi:hypothetical protein
MKKEQRCANHHHLEKKNIFSFENLRNKMFTYDCRTKSDFEDDEKART